jgi:hypothetical protein
MRNQYKILAEAYNQVKEAEQAGYPDSPRKKPFANNPYINKVGDRFKGLSAKPKKASAKAPAKEPEPVEQPEEKHKDVALLLTDLNDVLKADDREASAAYSEFLLALINSTNPEVKDAATKVLNSQGQDLKEEDEAISNPHGDYQGGNGF